jgi:hypothetical protein
MPPLIVDVRRQAAFAAAAAASGRGSWCSTSSRSGSPTFRATAAGRLLPVLGEASSSRVAQWLQEGYRDVGVLIGLQACSTPDTRFPAIPSATPAT